MNSNEKVGTEKIVNAKDKSYTLQGFLNKVNKVDQVTFSNYCVDYSELFGDGSEYTK